MTSSDDRRPAKESTRTQKSTLELYQESRVAQKRLNTLLKFLPDPVFAFSLDNTVEYVNPAFERVFGWTLEEVKGKNIKFVPDHLADQARKGMKQLFENRVVLDFETQRYTKDGRILDIVINGSILYDEYDQPMGQALILRDMTVQKRMAKANQIMFRISTALHSYQKLEDLIALINREIQKLISVEGAFILLADPSENCLYFYSAQYRDAESEKKFQKIRFPLDQGVSGHVFQTGEPLIIPDVSTCPFYLHRVNEETDLVTKNMMSVPIKLQDRTIGVVSVVNKNLGEFDHTDIELLSMVTSTIALPIENTRIHEELEKSYQELKALNHAKDKVINHLAHEMKTPVSVLGASFKLLGRKLTALGAITPQIETIFSRGQRNLDRILDIQYEVEDLLRRKKFKAYHLLNRLLDACKDELAVLFETESQDPKIIKRVGHAIEQIFASKEFELRSVRLDKYLAGQISHLQPILTARHCRIFPHVEKNISIQIPIEILDITIAGILKNAIEYTPDGGKIDLILKIIDNQPELIIKDYGIGFTKEKLHLIFENYFTPPDSTDYSTKNPYDFNAGGRGFDLLRIQIFSERYRFKVRINSTRCRFIPKDTDICPGNISRCPYCTTPEDCFNSGGTTVRIRFSAHP